MFCILIHYKKSLDIVSLQVAAHRAFLAEGYQKNYFIVSGPRNPRVGGVLLSQLTSREQLDAILKNDPYIMNDIADYEVLEFDPVLYHKDFAIFLDKKQS